MESICISPKTVEVTQNGNEINGRITEISVNGKNITLSNNATVHDIVKLAKTICASIVIKDKNIEYNGVRNDTNNICKGLAKEIAIRLDCECSDESVFFDASTLPDNIELDNMVFNIE